MELYQKVECIGEAYKNMLLQCNWEWFATLNLQMKNDVIFGEKKLREWGMKMGIANKILIGYMGVYNTIPQPHIHLLMLSKRNRIGQTLLDLDFKKWEAAWSALTKSQAVIEPIYDCKGVAHYIARVNMPWERSEIIVSPRTRILKKAMIQ